MASIRRGQPSRPAPSTDWQGRYSLGDCRLGRAGAAQRVQCDGTLTGVGDVLLAEPLHGVAALEVAFCERVWVLVIDASGDRKDGMVTVTRLWADGRIYHPLRMRCCTPAKHFTRGEADLGFRIKPQIGAEVAAQAAACSGRSRPMPPAVTWMWWYLPNPVRVEFSAGTGPQRARWRLSSDTRAA